MKSLFVLKKALSIIVLFVGLSLNAQIGINIDQPDPSAILHLQAADKGFLAPRLEEEGVVTNPAEGLIFYHTGRKAYFIYDGSAWRMMVPFIVEDNMVSTNYQMNASSYANNLTGNGPVPKGGIIMWSGSEVPVGWALCDGTNGTPDLKGRFVVGYHPENNDYNNPGDLSTGGVNTANIGGEERHRLSTSEMPSHNHNVRVTTDRYGFFEFASWADDDGDKNGDYSQANYPDHNWDYYDPNPQVTQQNRGGNTAHENRPPYYVLAYIMKL